MGEQRLHHALAPIDVLTKLDLETVMTHKMDAFIRDWYRGEDYMEVNGAQPPGSGDAILNGPESGYTWSLKLASAIPSATSSLVTVAAPVFPPGGSFRQQSYPFPVLVTFNDGTTFNVFGGGAANSAIGNGVSGPVSFVIYPGQAIGWNAATVAPTNWTWQAIEPAYLAVFSSTNKLTPPIGYSPANTVNGLSLATVTWSSNQAIIKTDRNITLSFGAGIDVLAWKIIVKQVPGEMEGKL